MDQIYFWIIILFLVILYLDYCEKKYKKEGFTNKEQMTNYYEENKLHVSNPVNTSSSINFNNKNLNFKNFSTDSANPPYLKCSLCKLDFNCVDYPYQVDNLNENVCHKCTNNVSSTKMNFPVYAKSVGRPRICRNLK